MVSLSFRLLRQANSWAKLGESPVWDPGRNDVWWVDIDGRKLFRMDLGAGHVQRWETPESPGFVVLTGPGRPAVGMQTGIFLFDPANSAFKRIRAFDRLGQRFNDATVDRSGRLWTSTMPLDARAGCAEIHVVTDDFALKTIVDGLTIPNGLAVDIDRGRLFYSDSHPDIQSIWIRRLQPDSLVLGEAAVFANTGEMKGRPDGAALDERGFYWIAGVDGSEIYVFDLEGQLDTVVPVPFPAPTKISFFGPQGRSVAVTSKGIGDDGGFLALADIPDASASGLAQPYWKIAAR